MHNEQRLELADFLRTRRGQLSPIEMGLPRMARRKTAGLRREEVAQLAAVGITWYTWLEQGRDINVSSQVLDSLAQTLRLTPAEKAHLFALAGQTPPALAIPPQEQISPFLNHFLEQMGNNPVYIMGRRWDVLAWNRAATQIVVDFATLPDDERNIMRIIFTNQEYRRRSVDWESVAQRALAQFRASSSLYHREAEFNSLIRELQQASPEFVSWWSRHEVQGREGGSKEFNHPKLGSLIFEHSTFQVDGSPGLKMVVYLPANEETVAKLEQLARG